MTEQSDDPVLYPPDTRPPDDNFSVEEREYLEALRKDLSAYDNVEVFYKESPDFRPKFRVASRQLAGNPEVLRVEIDARNLFLAIRESACINARQGKETGGETQSEDDWQRNDRLC